MNAIRYPCRLLAVLLALACLTSAGPASSAPAPSPTPSVHRVNVRPDAWSGEPIFWFGRANETDNYADVRVTYDGWGLYVSANVVDYWLWWDESGTTDPREYEAFAVYLDTSNARADTPQPSSRFVASGLRFWTPGDDSPWRRQGRGAGGGWDESWQPTPAWVDTTGARWTSWGANNNSDHDRGWSTEIAIPWGALGLPGPPASGTTWSLGAVLYDRDARPPDGAVPPKSWPDGFSTSSPATWGSLVFDPPPYQPVFTVNRETVSIRREGASPGPVVDAWAGGGGLCLGGVYGGGDTPHPGSWPDDPDLFVQNQGDISDFHCFSKSFLRFDLSAIPAGKTIARAMLQLYHFGNSNPLKAKPTFVQLFSVLSPWDETTLTWNNAPIAGENFDGTWVQPIPDNAPGAYYTWDATELVAGAYAAGVPASLAIYSADYDMHSGKYFRSSEFWDPAARPTLIVTWGDPAAAFQRVLIPKVAR